MRVYFKDKTMRTIHSRDYFGDSYEPHEGLLNLECHVIRHQGKIRTAVIYDRRETLKELQKPKEKRNRKPPKLIRLYAKGNWKLWKDVELF